MAPRVGAKSNQAAITAVSAPAEPAPGPELVRKLLAGIAAKQAEMLPRSRWVGRDFANAARAMHEGRRAEGLNPGQASPEEAEALTHDGTAPLPMPGPTL